MMKTEEIENEGISIEMPVALMGKYTRGELYSLEWNENWSENNE